MLIKDIIAAAVKRFARDKVTEEQLLASLAKLSDDRHYRGALNASATPEDTASFECRVENLVSCPFNSIEFMVKLICQDLTDVRYQLQQGAR